MIGNQRVYNLDWVDRFIQEIKPFVYVRERDRLLILVPNQVYRLNQSGVSILQYLLKGGSIRQLLDTVGDSDERRLELHYFFCDLRAVVCGCLRETDRREAVSYYEFSGAPNEYPVLSEIAVTYRCNLKCRFCYVGDRDYREMNTNDVKKVIFKIFNEAQVPSVSFTGGEPLLRDDIAELIDYAAGIGMWTNLITNGTLLNEGLVESLKGSGLRSAQMSIEGSNAGVHDGLTGVPGSFDATVNGIRLLMQAGISVHTNTTVSRGNLLDLINIVGLVEELGLKRFSMNLLIPCGAANKDRKLWVSYDEIGGYVLEVKERAESRGIQFLWYSPVPICKFNPIAYGFGNKSCAAITGLLSIDPVGNIIPCSSWRMPVGNLLKKSFQSIWNSPMLSYFKRADYAPARCHQCSYFDICKGACPLYWKVHNLEELDGRASRLSHIR